MEEGRDQKRRIENMEVASIRKEMEGDSFGSFYLSDHLVECTNIFKLFRFITKGTAT